MKALVLPLLVVGSLAFCPACDRGAERSASLSPEMPAPPPREVADPFSARSESVPKPTTMTAVDAGGKELEVPFVTTPMEIVDKILEMGRVDQHDVLYDLGSGDGRIVIRAAQKFGTRGVGFDLDPARIKESRENAAKAGVSHLVEFREQDIFTVDLRAATVVTMYLLPEVNLRLRPKLLAELPAGTRVVSHNHGMGDWQEEEVATFEVDGETHYATVWVMPPPMKK